MKKRYKLAWLAGAGTLVACSIATTPAYAALTTLTDTGQTIGNETSLPSGTLQTTLNSGPVTSFDGDFTGTLQTSVYSGGDGAGNTGLTFVYLVTETASTGTGIDELTVPGWGGGAEAAYYVSGTTSDVPPIQGLVNTGGVLNFQWGGFTAVGDTLELIVETPLTSYGGVSATLDNSSPAYPVSALAPIPEPTTMIAGAFLLLPMGLSTLRAVRKNRAA